LKLKFISIQIIRIHELCYHLFRCNKIQKGNNINENNDDHENTTNLLKLEELIILPIHHADMI
jgi:hypothetical protein